MKQNYFFPVWRLSFILIALYGFYDAELGIGMRWYILLLWGISGSVFYIYKWLKGDIK